MRNPERSGLKGIIQLFKTTVGNPKVCGTFGRIIDFLE